MKRFFTPIYLIIFSIVFFYTPTPAFTSNEPIKIVSYNIQSGCSAPMDEGTFNLNQVINYIKQLNADIILLQEVGYNTKGSCKGTGSNMTQTIASALNMQSYAYGTVSLFTKFTITSKSGKNFSDQISGGSRKYMDVTIKTPSNNSFAVLNAHTERGFSGGNYTQGIEVRKKQIQELHTIAQNKINTGIPVIVGGDFNECDSNFISNTFSEFHNPVSGITFTPTPPTDLLTKQKLALSSSCNSSTGNSQNPTIDEQLDYILADKNHWVTQNASILTSAGNLSDHFPVQTIFELKSAVASTIAVQKVEKNNSLIYNFTSQCSGSAGAKQEIIIKKTSTSFKDVYFIIHGTDGALGNAYCEGGYQLCNHVQNLSDSILVGLRTKDYNWDNLYNDINFSCLYNETQNAIANIPEIQSFPKDISLVGYSAGGYALKTIYSKNQLPSSAHVIYTIFEDSCFDTNCQSVAKISSSQRGVMYMYTSPKTGSSGTTLKNNAIAASKLSNDNIHHLHSDTLNHGNIFNACFENHISSDLCGGKASIVSSSGATQGTITGENIATITVDTKIPFINEVELVLNKPILKIKIPGVNFSSVKQVQDSDGSTYLQVPFLGEYISAVYKYLVILAGIVATIMLILAGVQWMMPGNIITQDEKNINQAKNRIQKTVIGLVLIITSYTILYTINPELVQFRNLKVKYLQGELLVGRIIEEADGNSSQTTSNYQPTGTASSNIAQKTSSISEVTSDFFLTTEINDIKSNGWDIWNKLGTSDKQEIIPYLYKQIADECPGTENWVQITGIPGWNGKYIHKEALEPFRKAYQYANELGFTFVMGSTIRRPADLIPLWNTGIVARYQQSVKQGKKIGNWKTNEGIIATPNCNAPHATGGAVDINLKSNMTGKIVLGANGGKISKSNYSQKFFGVNTTNQDWEKLGPYRVLLEHIMNKAGFVRLCTEHWHFEYGVTERYNKWQKAGANTRCWAYTDSYDEQIPQEIINKINKIVNRNIF